MIPLIQLPFRKLQSGVAQTEVGPRTTAIVLALILCFQIGLLLCVFF
jgi:hypothetical protein